VDVVVIYTGVWGGICPDPGLATFTPTGSDPSLATLVPTTVLGSFSPFCLSFQLHYFFAFYYTFVPRPLVLVYRPSIYIRSLSPPACLRLLCPFVLRHLGLTETHTGGTGCPIHHSHPPHPNAQIAPVISTSVFQKLRYRPAGPVSSALGVVKQVTCCLTSGFGADLLTYALLAPV
jgi:hypothetical protein